MLSMVSGFARLLTEPAGRRHHASSSRCARSRRRSRRTSSRSTRRRSARAVYLFALDAAVLEPGPVGRGPTSPSSPCASTGCAPDGPRRPAPLRGIDRPGPGPRAAAPPSPIPRADVALTDRIALAMCWGAGLLLVVIAGDDRALHALPRAAVRHPRPADLPPAARARPVQTGGFLDPIIGTVLLTVVGIAIATPIAVGHGGVDRRVRAPELAGSRGRGRHRGRRRHPRHRASRSSAWRSSSSTSSPRCRSPPTAARCSAVRS